VITNGASVPPDDEPSGWTADSDAYKCIVPWIETISSAPQAGDYPIMINNGILALSVDTGYRQTLTDKRTDMVVA